MTRELDKEALEAAWWEYVRHEGEECPGGVEAAIRTYLTHARPTLPEGAVATAEAAIDGYLPSGSPFAYPTDLMAQAALSAAFPALIAENEALKREVERLQRAEMPQGILDALGVTHLNVGDGFVWDGHHALFDTEADARQALAGKVPQ